MGSDGVGGVGSRSEVSGSKGRVPGYMFLMMAVATALAFASATRLLS